MLTLRIKIETQNDDDNDIPSIINRLRKLSQEVNSSYIDSEFEDGKYSGYYSLLKSVNYNEKCPQCVKQKSLCIDCCPF